MAVAAPKVTKSRSREKPDVPGITRPMTYEEYMAGPEEMARYDIIDGWKVYRLYGEKQLPNPTRQHQRIALNLAEQFRAFERREQQGETLVAPCDVRITLRPLRSRQPDVLFISQARLAANAPADNPAPLSPAPELVVEIVSPSDKPSVLAAKIADYRAVDVQEVWVVRAEAQSVEVLRLSIDEIETVAEYGPGQTVASAVFSDLKVAVADIFAV
ncbi:MAG: Uma2 family endonuclease [Armatimonadetes bacterium]|nr:Uma2 family endonuclease [Armatimonadota bacterium]